MTAGLPVLEVEGLSKTFDPGRTWLGRPRGTPLQAVADVSFVVARGQTLGIVGESGSGKSTTARMLLRLIEPTSGALRLNGRDLRALDADGLRRQRRGIQMVFQDPFASLNPRLSIGAQIGEPILIHGLAPQGDIADRVTALLRTVGLDPTRSGAYPHEFSGGQRQRIAIARALAAQPDLVVADEAVSALDVSIRAQILNLLDDLKTAAGLTMIFVSHDLAVVRHLADRIAVMYRGRIVEIGPAETLFRTPRHPYTRALLSAMPVARAGARRERSATAPGHDGDPVRGCPYAARCILANDACRAERPALASVATDHASACFHASQVAPFEEAPPRATATEERLRRLQKRFASPRASPAMGTAP